jgi:hypothetical protein
MAVPLMIPMRSIVSGSRRRRRNKPEAAMRGMPTYRSSALSVPLPRSRSSPFDVSAR